MKKISLKPYSGNLYFVKTIKYYEKAHKKIFKKSDVLGCHQDGRFSGAEGKDGGWNYLVYAKTSEVLAHEMCHVIFHVFERCGINPSDSGGEQFCYLLSQLLIDAKND